MKKTCLMASLVVTIGYLAGAVQAADTSSAEAVDVVAVSGEAADCVRDLIEPGLSPEATGLSPEAALIQCLSKYPDAIEQIISVAAYGLDVDEVKKLVEIARLSLGDGASPKIVAGLLSAGHSPDLILEAAATGQPASAAGGFGSAAAPGWRSLSNSGGGGGGTVGVSAS